MSASTTVTTAANAAKRMPSIFLSHGAGPSFFMKDGFPGLGADSAAARWMRQLATQLGFTAAAGARYGVPKSIVVFTAHWETGFPIRVSAQEKHTKLYYDYYGFPDETYQLTYPAPGNPALSQRIQSLLEKQTGITATLDTKRDFDHGVFLPLKLFFPDANIPVVAVSVHESIDPDTHLRMGEALQSLRDEGVLIIGSGQITHGRSEPKKQLAFVDAFDKSIVNDASITPAQRRQRLVDWHQLPNSRYAHPRPEHFIPMHVVAGVAGCSQPEKIGNEGAPEMGMSIASYLFP